MNNRPLWIIAFAFIGFYLLKALKDRIVLRIRNGKERRL